MALSEKYSAPLGEKLESPLIVKQHDKTACLGAVPEYPAGGQEGVEFAFAVFGVSDASDFYEVAGKMRAEADFDTDQVNLGDGSGRTKFPTVKELTKAVAGKSVRPKMSFLRHKAMLTYAVRAPNDFVVDSVINLLVSGVTGELISQRVSGKCVVREIKDLSATSPYTAAQIGDELTSVHPALRRPVSETTESKSVVAEMGQNLAGHEDAVVVSVMAPIVMQFADAFKDNIRYALSQILADDPALQNVGMSNIPPFTRELPRRRIQFPHLDPEHVANDNHEICAAIAADLNVNSDQMHCVVGGGAWEEFEHLENIDINEDFVGAVDPSGSSRLPRGSHQDQPAPLSRPIAPPQGCRVFFRRLWRLRPRQVHATRAEDGLRRQLDGRPVRLRLPVPRRRRRRGRRDLGAHLPQAQRQGRVHRRRRQRDLRDREGYPLRGLRGWIHPGRRAARSVLSSLPCLRLSWTPPTTTTTRTGGATITPPPPRFPCPGSAARRTRRRTRIPPSPPSARASPSTTTPAASGEDVWVTIQVPMNVERQFVREQLFPTLASIVTGSGATGVVDDDIAHVHSHFVIIGGIIVPDTISTYAEIDQLCRALEVDLDVGPGSDTGGEMACYGNGTADVFLTAESTLGKPDGTPRLGEGEVEPVSGRVIVFAITEVHDESKFADLISRINLSVVSSEVDFDTVAALSGGHYPIVQYIRHHARLTYAIDVHSRKNADYVMAALKNLNNQALLSQTMQGQVFIRNVVYRLPPHVALETEVDAEVTANRTEWLWNAPMDARGARTPQA